VVKRTQLIFFVTSKLAIEATVRKRAQVISTAVLFLLLGTTALAHAQQEQQGDKQAKPEKQAQAEKQQRAEQQQQQNQNKQQQERAQQQQNRNNQQQQVGRQQQQQQDLNRQRQQQDIQAQQQQGRLSQQRQQQLIEQQQQRIAQYRQHLDQQQQQQQRQAVQQQTAMLREQNRASQYRFQEEYLERMRQQQVRLDNDHDHDYNRDPYFYTAPTYRYNRVGSYYETNQYGADLLRRSVNYGYEEGFRTGEADRQDRWRSGYRDSYAYQDANYGYTGYYVDQDEYNYYFRQGFSRGYDDGFSSRNQYGSYSNGSYSVLGAILGQILDFQSLR